MDALTIGAFALGFLGALWLSTVVGVTYVVWRYVFKPWKALRTDVVALNGKLDEHITWTRNELGLRKVMGMDDEQLAILEQRAKARKLWPPPATVARPA